MLGSSKAGGLSKATLGLGGGVAGAGTPSTSKQLGKNKWMHVLERYEQPGYEPEQLTGKAAQTAEIEAAKFIQAKDTLNILTSSYLETAAAGFALRAREDDVLAQAGAVETGSDELALRLAAVLKGKDLSVLMEEWDPNKVTPTDPPLTSH